MSMNKNKLLMVFKFSFLQSVKNKTFVILTLVCAIMMMIIIPITAQMGASQSENRSTSIKSVEVIDENGFLEKALGLTKKPKKIEALGNIKVSIVNLENVNLENVDLEKNSVEKYKKEFEKDKTKANTLLVQASNSKKGYVLDIYKQEKTKVKDNDIMVFSALLESVYKSSKVANMKIAPDKIVMVNTPTEINVKVDGVKDRDKESEITIVMIFLFVTVFFIVINGENISTQIVTEKSTKLVEYLLTSIGPLDLVGGKILAAVSISFIQIVTMIGSGLLSMYVCKINGLVTSFEDTLTLFNIKNIGGDISVLDGLLILAFLIIGFLFYSIIACCLASTVSKLEELGNVNMIYSMITLISIYAIIALVNFGSSSGGYMEKICILIPFTAVYLAPAYILLGKLSAMWIIASLMLQIILLIIFAVIASKIYKGLIMYTGKKITFRQLFSLIKHGEEMQKN